ncbi:hypothetical protein MRB53_026249 [Persea americana]|uniref:Uncharacterized protein n=1 Tax=Persea americana TaxID=3435 RepID=A0ACC2LIA8_PERAE|nr:hypothetical protein MRB53_026249 [Persea americana]
MRALVDPGSSSEVLYYDCFKKLKLKDEDLQAARTPLVGFSSTPVYPKGKISLRVQVGGACRQVDFLVVNVPSPYNVIMGRTWLHSMEAVPSTRHQKLKFPLENQSGRTDVITVRGDRHMARQCLLAVLPGEAEPSQVNVAELDREAELGDVGRAPAQKSIEDLTKVNIDPADPDRFFLVGSQLPESEKTELLDLLVENKAVFAWTPYEMPGIDPAVICHELKVNPNHKPVLQKPRRTGVPQTEAVVEEVQKLLEAGAIKEVHYPQWLANTVVVKKKTGKWRVCVDFTDLNKACPKDSFPLPKIDQLIDATAGHDRMSFLDAYRGYHQIPLYAADQEKIAFITPRGTYCYKVMPFGLKNAGATYQRLVTKMFQAQLGKTVEVYIDDMVIKSKKSQDHLTDLRQIFGILHQYQLKLNASKCAFGVGSGKFLGSLVTRRGIEANPDQITAIQELQCPTLAKQVQRLTGMAAALNRFISRASDKCRPFFQLLRKGSKFQWTTDCSQALQQLKQYLSSPPLLSTPTLGEALFLYLSVSDHAVSSVLVREDNGQQRPIYYTSKTLLDAETRYLQLEKLALALVTASRKLSHYFQTFTVVVVTEYPLKALLRKADFSGRISKWLSNWGNMTSAINPEQPSKLKAGAGVVLQSPEGLVIEQALTLSFKASNNEAEYEALIAGLNSAKILEARSVVVFSDSQLVTSQLSGDYQARDVRMAAYLARARGLLSQFERTEVRQIGRESNSHANALASLTSAVEASEKRTIEVETLREPSIDLQQPRQLMCLDLGPSWMDPIIAYLKDDQLPEDRTEARKVRLKATRFWLSPDSKLYRKSFTGLYLQCIHPSKVDDFLYEIHEGICGSHIGGRSLAYRAISQGYWWPYMQKDAQLYARKCEKCQKFSHSLHQPAQDLSPLSSPWPFAQWGLDIVGPLHRTPGSKRLLIVATDYFTKWVEAEPLSSLTELDTKNFVWKNIITRFGTPRTLISDNGTQFDSNLFKSFCQEYGIRNIYSTPAYPQSNGQAEISNKVLLDGIEKRLDRAKVIPLEVGLPTLRSELCEQGLNDLNVARELDLAEERREAAAIRLTAYQQQLARGYNPNVKERRFAIGELVLKKTLPGDRDPNEGKLAPNWQGPRFFWNESLHYLDSPRLDASNRSINCQLGAIASFDKAIHIRVRYQYHPRGSVPLFRGPTALGSVPAPARAAQPRAHQGLVALPPLRLGASVQRANRPPLGACTSLGGTAICTSGSGIRTNLAARHLCSEGKPPSARCLHQPRRYSQKHQGPVPVPPSRLGASVQRANRPRLGACTSPGGTAMRSSGSGRSTSLAARRLCLEGQPPSARCLHQPGRHNHMHIRVRYQYHPRGSAPLFRGQTALSSVPAPAWAVQPKASGSGTSTTLAARRLCSEGQPPSARCLHQPGRHSLARIKRVNRPPLGACTSLGGTAICTLGSGISTTLAARRLCSKGQLPSARSFHQPRQHSHMHIRVRYQNHPRGSAPLFRGQTALSSVPAPAWAAQPKASGSGTSTTLAARLLCSEGQPPSLKADSISAAFPLNAISREPCAWFR